MLLPKVLLDVTQQASSVLKSLRLLDAAGTLISFAA